MPNEDLDLFCAGGTSPPVPATASLALAIFPGFHAMRRFRTTWLRKQRAPEDLVRFWLGHAKQSMTDGYSKLAEDTEFRAQVADNIGTGFAVPSVMRPMRPRKSKKVELEVDA
jgi:hypothetical protein